MDSLLEQMINKGLASIKQREILATIPVWFASLRQIEWDWLYWTEWLGANRN